MLTRALLVASSFVACCAASASAQAPRFYVIVGPGSGLPPAHLDELAHALADVLAERSDVVVAPTGTLVVPGLATAGSLGLEALVLEWSVTTTHVDATLAIGVRNVVTTHAVTVAEIRIAAGRLSADMVTDALDAAIRAGPLLRAFDHL